MIWGGAPAQATTTVTAAASGGGPNVTANAQIPGESLDRVTSLASTYLGLGGIYGAATAYWGLRALNAAAGAARMNAIQVRRASDNSTQNITVLPNGALDVVTLTAFLAGAIGYVATWYDQSGNGYHISQAANSLQPQIVLSAIGSLPAVLFDGASTYLEYPGGIPTLNAPVTFGSFAYPNMGATTNTNYVYLDSVSGGWQGWQVDGFGSDNFAVFFAGGASVANANDSWHAVQLIANKVSSSVNLDGTTTSLSLGADPQVSGANAIGCDISGSSGPYQEYFKGYLVETSIFALGATAAQTAAAYADQKAAWINFTEPASPAYPLEAGQRQQRDSNQPLEFSGVTGTTIDGDSLAPVEFGGRQAADPKLVIENTARILDDFLCPAEMPAMQRGDLKASAENGAWQRSDPLAQLEGQARQLHDTGDPFENTGTTAVISDRILPIEVASGLLFDARHALDVLAGQRQDAGLRLEALTTARADSLARANFISSSARDVLFPDEWAGLAVLIADTLLRIEVSARLQSDANTPAEATGAASTNVAGDAGVAIEWAGLLRLDAIAATEALSGVADDLRGFVELLHLARNDYQSALELIGRIVADEGLPSESIGQAVTIIDAALRIETAASQRSDGATLAEALGTAGIGSSASVPIEGSAGPIIGIPFGRLLRSVGRIRRLGTAPQTPISTPGGRRWN